MVHYDENRDAFRRRSKANKPNGSANYYWVEAKNAANLTAEEVAFLKDKDGVTGSEFFLGIIKNEELLGWFKKTELIQKAEAEGFDFRESDDDDDIVIFEKDGKTVVIDTSLDEVILNDFE
jgi:hypothetical protein